ncbi:MAG: tRNA (adenosine(37)-N6)-dimethylallyltransferase MiaA [Bacilli bacterium]
MIIAVVGPTGVGKTKLSVELAKKYNAIIISCDATQIYKGLNIGSAKVTEEEKEGIEHFLIDILDPNEYYTVKNYQENFRELLEKYKDRNIIIVGGTGLYLCAGILDYRFSEEENNIEFNNFTTEELFNMALLKDKNMQIDKNNRVRLIRFLSKKETENVEPVPLYSVTIVGLTTNRKTLYENINKRVDNMINSGLIDEVKKLNLEYPDSRILKTAIGYKEIIAYLNGVVELDTAIDEIKKNSRHYAKRQYTWFKNKMDVKWFDVSYNCFTSTINEVKDYIENIYKI